MIPYNFEIAISATISSKVVKEIIKKTVEEQTGKKVSSITPSDDGGYTVFFESEKAVAAASNGKPFRENTYS